MFLVGAATVLLVAFFVVMGIVGAVGNPDEAAIQAIVAVLVVSFIVGIYFLLKLDIVSLT